jgi:hypothetical protein
MADQLDPLAKQMEQQEEQKLAEATDELGKSLLDQDRESFQAATNQLATFSRQLALRSAVASQLNSQLNRLTEAKAFSLSGGKSARRSEQPRQTWGRGSDGNPFSEQATSLETKRQRENITGTAGEGPTERELTRTLQGEQTATRDYQQVYQEYRRQAEDALLHEDLPLSHRQTIRDYFEAIRPDREER